MPFKPGLARFACDITVEGQEWPYCPRTILRHQLARAKELGYTFKVGMELEFFLLREKADGGIELADHARQARSALLRHEGRSRASTSS